MRYEASSLFDVNAFTALDDASVRTGNNSISVKLNKFTFLSIEIIQMRKM